MPKPQRIESSVLGVAGEFAVAAELCRRGVYAQLTFGHRKRADLLVDGKKGMYRIEVKAKQARDWPNCRGISSEDSFLVFVDYAGKQDEQRPDFYILTAPEWLAFVQAEVNHYRTKHPDRHAEIVGGVVVLLDEVNKYGKSYQGWGVRAEQVHVYREAWHKIISVAGMECHEKPSGK